MNLHDLTESIQAELARLGLDGWLFFDHHFRDPIGYQVLNLELKQTPTRRWYYLIPRTGEPQALVHRIESHILDSLPGQKHLYSGWRTQQDGLGTLLFGLKRIAMQYSPGCAIPYVSMVDGGTLELIRSFGVEVATSADLIQVFHARLNHAQIDSHRTAGVAMDAIRRAAFVEAATGRYSEFTLRAWLLNAFEREGLSTDHGPIVAVNANAADPHFEPTADRSLPIRAGDFLLIDMWAKWNRPHSVFYDITWTGYLGSNPPSEMDKVFGIVRQARDAAFETVRAAMAAQSPVFGFEVDDAARGLIQAAGFADQFVHRTGHSITEDVHGTGANMDNLETHDERRILSNTIFSIEPGIYLDTFGVRSEFNVLALANSAEVTGEIQQALLRL
jgi:Xaa-Pro dipeptidase